MLRDLDVRANRLVALAFAFVACGAQKAEAPVGTSTSAPPSTASAKDAGVLPRDAGIPADYETSMRKVNAAPFVTSGHAAGRWDADVYANDGGASALGQARGAAPVGAKLLMVHRERAGGGRGPIMMMEKRAPGYDPEHGDWRYVVVASTGELAQDGPIASCAGCHDDAPHDRLFAIGP